MKKKYIIIFTLVLSSFFSFGQVNLVPNGSFEEYTDCPEFEDQINFATGWSKYSEEISTPDYYNVCGLPSGYGIPNNIGDFQLDNRKCGAYAGLITFASNLSNYREIIGIQLNQQLIIGQTYYISFYTVLGQSKIGGNHNSLPSNNIGIHLSTNEYNKNNPIPLNNFAHLNYNSIVIDTVDWTYISGSFIADSTYNYLAVGNFFNDFNTDTINYNCSSCQNNYSYYFVDDICLSTNPNFCNNISTCDLSTTENLENQFIIYPNPSNDYMNIDFSNNYSFSGELTIYNSIGVSYINKKIQGENSIKLSLSEIPYGYYMLKLEDTKSNQLTIKKILKTN